VEPVKRVAGRMAPLDLADVDTDQIIPKQFLKRIERTGYGPFLFYDWRARDNFVLDRPEYAGASVLVAGANFGCGSSREPAAGAGGAQRLSIAPTPPHLWGGAGEAAGGAQVMSIAAVPQAMPSRPSLRHQTTSDGPVANARGIIARISKVAMPPGAMRATDAQLS